jgi:hypothetical protein
MGRITAVRFSVGRGNFLFITKSRLILAPYSMTVSLSWVKQLEMKLTIHLQLMIKYIYLILVYLTIFNTPDYTAWNDSDNWTKNWKGCGRKVPRHHLWYDPEICLQRLKKAANPFVQDSGTSWTRVESHLFFLHVKYIQFYEPLLLNPFF